jgi:hypothetical protein
MSSYVPSDSISSVFSVSLSPPPSLRHSPSPTSPLARGRLPSPLSGKPLGPDDLDSPPSSPTTQTLDNEPAIPWHTDSPPLLARSNVYHIQAVDIPLYANKLRSDDASSEALNQLCLYLHDARYTKDIYAHADVDSPLHSLYNAYIHTSRLEGLASNLRNSSNSHSAFLSSQITLVQRAVAEHLLSAMHQLGMTEFVANLDRFLAEMTIYSTPSTIPSPPCPHPHRDRGS